ncbi:MAG: cellulase family glycosylhydrolase [Treponema sp.]|jgi:hypothetical protein|nr:cellulase family glycosylhydrolase [Treponema sp.]
MVIKDNFFMDAYGRALILRGCNVSGASKTPVSETYPAPLKNPADASFVGRPFPLEEAEAHFERLRAFGFNVVRLLVTWEAVEHAGPGVYDEAYLAYLRKLLLAAEKYNIAVYMDPHQDVWSRWTGGDGAPAWTLEKLGVDIEKLGAAGAALTEQDCHEKGEPFPRMIWPTNYNRYAAATMFTLFYAGDTYAPHCMIDGETAQSYLQERYIAAMRHCCRRLKACKAIIGWGAMNEPHQGFIGYGDLAGLENYSVALGPMPSPFKAMAAASGHTVEFPVYATDIFGERITGKRVYGGVSIFRDGFTCPWKREGVWTDESAGDSGEPRLLKKDHFALYNNRKAIFTDDFLKPFINKFAAHMKEAQENVFIFVEGLPVGAHPSWTKKDAPNAVNAFHWYDGLTLFTKRFRPWLTIDAGAYGAHGARKLILGKKNVVAHFTKRLAESVKWTREHMGDIPCLLGEFGLPFDMNNRKAFRTHDYRLHEQALSMYYDAIDNNLLNATIWNYTPDNVNACGDGWNGEDLSIFAEGQERGVRGWLRPYPMATAGVPLSIRWDRKRRVFTYRFKADPSIQEPTELFIPPMWFGEKLVVTASEPLAYDYFPENARLFIYNNGFSGEAEITATS